MTKSEEQRNRIRTMTMKESREVLRSDFLKLIPAKRADAVSMEKLSRELNISTTILGVWCREANLNVTADGYVWRDVYSRAPVSESTYKRKPERR